jgi:hypothetical protein
MLRPLKRPRARPGGLLGLVAASVELLNVLLERGDLPLQAVGSVEDLCPRFRPPENIIQAQDILL